MWWTEVQDGTRDKSWDIRYQYGLFGQPWTLDLPVSNGWPRHHLGLSRRCSPHLHTELRWKGWRHSDRKVSIEKPWRHSGYSGRTLKSSWGWWGCDFLGAYDHGNNNHQKFGLITPITTASLPSINEHRHTDSSFARGLGLGPCFWGAQRVETNIFSISSWWIIRTFSVSNQYCLAPILYSWLEHISHGHITSHNFTHMHPHSLFTLRRKMRCTSARAQHPRRHGFRAHTTCTAHRNFWLVVWTPLKNIHQLGWLFPIYKEKKPCSKPPTRTWHEYNEYGNMILFVHISCRGLVAGGLQQPWPSPSKGEILAAMMRSPDWTDSLTPNTQKISHQTHPLERLKTRNILKKLQEIGYI